MNGLEVGKCVLESHQIVGNETAADIDVLREEGDTVSHCCEAANHDELNAVTDQSVQEALKVRQVRRSMACRRAGAALRARPCVSMRVCGVLRKLLPRSDMSHP